MASNDPSSDLDSRITAIVENTVGRVRDELMLRLQDTESRLRSIAGRLGDEEPAEPAGDAAPEPAAATAAAAAETIADLFEAISAIDKGGSQQDVLSSLLEGLGRFAARSALFLTRAGGARGWGSYGFEDLTGEIQDVELAYGEGPLALLAEGRGCVELSADECRDLCARLGASPGDEGLLVPFVLRDRLAAVLYADRFAEDPPLAQRQLQLLAYVGALAVEGLNLRQRSETPTLRVATGDAAAAGVALWEAPAAEQPPAAPPAPEPPPDEPQLTEPESAEPLLTEPQPAEPPPVDTLPSGPPADRLVAVEAPETPAVAVDEAPAVAEQEPAAGDEWELPEMPDDLQSVAPHPPAAAAVEPPPAVETPDEPAPAAPPEDEPAVAAPPWEPTGEDALTTPEVEPVPAPAEPALPVEDQAAAGPGGSTEVRPPTDVSGPGWAFTAGRAAAESSDDTQHEEARRLARLLVTEIKLYNEEQVEEGRRGKDIYSRLREDIDRSRQIFNERVEEDVRQQTDYFHEEMVRILAGGNEEALGL